MMITEEKRQALIYEAKFLIENHGGNLEELLCIALASLEAEPECWEIAGQIFSTREEALKAGYRGTIEPLYGEPAVPALKPIVLNDDNTDEPIDWYAGAKTRDMVIAIIRAAGYGVTDHE